ncbi:GNAT family N-acetyltransferase [Erythrobacter sp. F6033]|uniref:GNAT family N-acetyltransferase n=1 Tax=Erythrobacter sp. F6033 TaxID=2926401 RepID=UPI001FF11E75|nr:GNAT family N-acetyltransferase [Erythrobacter sp. F6033]MCK0127940.1 GNAT family N-acetyltransferase [Erythrobacter sp. F6033]
MNPCPHLVDRIMEVMEAAFDPAFGEAWNRRQVSDALTMPSTHAILIDNEGALIETPETGAAAGFVMTRHAADEEELLLIAVHPSSRRSGLGEKLVNALFEAAKARGTKRIFLEMRRENPAEHLYRKTGFKPIGKRPNYYLMIDGSRVDAITFGHSL